MVSVTLLSTVLSNVFQLSNNRVITVYSSSIMSDRRPTADFFNNVCGTFVQRQAMKIGDFCTTGHSSAALQGHASAKENTVTRDAMFPIHFSPGERGY